MTYQELLNSDKIMLVPEDVTDVLGCKPYSINVQAQADPKKLGFPVCVLGRRIKIPRKAFIEWLEHAYSQVT